jgi:MFS family permease
MGAYGVGAIIASAVGGHLADSFGRRNTIVLSMFSSAVVMMALSQAQSFPAFIVLAVLAGATAELYRPAASALIADVTRPDQRVTAFAVFRLAINLGFAVGPVVGGLMAERSFFLVFAGDAITSALFGVVAMFMLTNRTTEHERPRSGRGVMVVLQDTYLLLFLVAATITAFVYMQSHTVYPLQIDAYGFSAKVYGMLISVNGLLVVLIELPLTAVTRHRNPHAVMFVGYLLVGVGFGLTAFVNSLAGLAGTVAIWTLGEIVLVPVAVAHVANISPPDMRGRYQGAFGMTWGIGGVVAPIAGAAIFGADPRALWVLCFALCAVAAGIVAVARPGKVQTEGAA